jgi:hypothetical protein
VDTVKEACGENDRGRQAAKNIRLDQRVHRFRMASGVRGKSADATRA